MGRLDDHAKRRIVELHRAGLSFRKIKKVLELDDIRVTPQAVYLFLKRKTVEPGPLADGWGGEQPWPPPQGHESEPPQPLGTRPPTLPSAAPASGRDSKEGIQIVSVASLCEGGRQPGVALPAGLPPGKDDDSSMGAPLAVGSCQMPGTPAAPMQALPIRGRLVMPPDRNPALMVKKIVDKTLFLQKKVKDASTQTAAPNPASPGYQHFAWGEAALPPAPGSHAIAEKLDAVYTEIHKLSQALHAVLERQCRLERQQEHQQRLQQEMLMTLQQLSSTVSHGAVPANQPCIPFSSMAEPLPTVPNFSQFKMELI